MPHTTSLGNAQNIVLHPRIQDYIQNNLCCLTCCTRNYRLYNPSARRSLTLLPPQLLLVQLHIQDVCAPFHKQCDLVF